MKKPKKITVKFFLNKNLKEIVIQGDFCYPLYTQITYDRKNTQIKCMYGGYYKSIEQVQEETPNLLDFEEKILKRSVNYELGKLGDEFKLKGLGRKYENYCKSIHKLFNSYLKLRFKNIIKDASPRRFLEVLNLNSQDIDFFVIYDASVKLFDNLPEILEEGFKEEMRIYQTYFAMYETTLSDGKYKFPVVIDWLEGSHQQELKNKLEVSFQNESQMIEKSMELIHKIVSTKLELV